MNTLKSVIAMALTGATLSIQAAQLDIHLTNVALNQGSIKVAVYNSAEGMKQYQAWEVLEQKAEAEQVTFTVKDVPHGEYAVMVYQDLNSDSKLGRNLIGIPNEPYGFSNNPRLMGPPKFSQLAIEVKTDVTSTHIELR